MFIRILKRLFWGRTITTKSCSKLICYIEKAETLSYKEQIIQYDKIYHHTLKDLGYRGTFGEILKRRPREVKNIQDIWDLHKVRNSLVHELKDRDEKVLKQQAEKYREISERFVNNVTK